MQKKKMSMEHLREWSHLRGRTNTIGAALRIRNRAYMAMHDYYQRNQYTHYPTPLLTASDCEGAGEMLRVTHSNPSNQMAADLFGAPSFLTVSGQLHLECGSYALGDCYTFGPAFRAENSHTRRHLAEFYMLEAELFYTDTVDDVIRTLSKSFKHTISEVLAHCADEVDFLSKWVDTDLRSRLEAELARPIVALSYTDAVEIINTNYAGKSELKWGDDLSSEHELWLTEEWCKGSVFITDYPSAIKPFYMLRNDDGNTAACVDMLVPRVCELAGGSLREHRVDVLRNNIAAHASPDTAEDADTNLDRQGKQDSKPNHMEWYEDLRKYGGVPHGGFGLGFERLVQYLTGIRNIRDVIPFPRVPGAIKY
ncbi:asparaginyl-tRNA synthetase [Sphaeroforma arctica JP610]|uniref:asparagine--tRNA ligase n=1 Tax=Sphaeroforma arctica JP610 TaxID=667725 RepID=A0A0L0G0G9_9EUKA|nr:asparaginyl-tRNA synthetase [Sphaeroforma arctica JP610]KNC82587.1 asparaginyl-tRNA synthetase [Sphaeroforma arctica JP610]|eukprot:XP_014156489.1 asparaginyl-tRNA synthetase [Sphaeroforma arctica JP610]